MTDLEGQTAIVTGGTRGIGAAITENLLEAGARVLATYHADVAAAEQLVQQQGEAVRERLSVHQFDLADQDAVQRFFSDEVPGGGAQILVNNGGVRDDRVLGLMSAEAWERVLAVNLSGTFFMCKQAVRAMMSARYGRIVNVVSPSGTLGFAGQANYAASKAGVVGMTRSLAREVARRGISVNCVCPGFVLTDLIRDLPEETLQTYRRDIPMGRFAEPEEVAAAVRFLVSGDASYITGAVLPVTGGIVV